MKKLAKHLSMLAMTFALVLASVFAASTVLSSDLFVSAAVNTSANGKYYTDFSSFDEELEYAAELNAEILSESAVLLKNENDALPLDSTETNVSLFGYRSYDLFTGGLGSGEVKGEAQSITDSLEDAGFNVNPRLSYLYSYYSDTQKIATHEAAVEFSQTVEVDPSFLTGAEGSFSVYGDAAIITIGRNGGEADDVMMADVPTHSDADDHYLQLDDYEQELFEIVKGWKGEYFDKLIVIINSGNVVQIPELEDDDDIDSILWIGFPGNDGIMGLGKLLSGEISPSGRTADVWAANFKTDPTWFNMGGYEQFMTDDDDEDSYRYNDVYDSTGTKVEDTDNMQYEEGIYSGYRWYETAAITTASGGNVVDADPETTTSVLKDSAVGYSEEDDTYEGDDIYYNRSTGVVYPFGYGLSYTTFSQAISNYSGLSDTIVEKLSTGDLDDTFTIDVDVTNTGSVAGKEVVEVYAEQPYEIGSVEKAARVLVGFAKTETLDPGETDTVSVSIRVTDVASFDYSNVSGLFKTGEGGYVLESGAYEFKLMSNSHEEATASSGGYTSVTATLSEDVAFDGEDDPDNVFSQDNEYNTLMAMETYSDPETDYGVKGDAMTLMSRAGFADSFPTAPTEDSQTYSDAILDMTDRMLSNVTDSTWDEETDPWLVGEDYDYTVPSDWTQDADSDLNLADMAGKDWEDDDWTELMNKMSWDDLITVVSNCGFTVPAIESIERAESYSDDGPAQLGDDGTAWCCDTNIATTWNQELANQQGIMMGNESIYLGITGWYGPGSNTHRSPFGGRNYEYYSSDGVHAGYIAAAVTKGAASKGTQIFLKHFAINDSETNRETVDTWLSEQSMREIYLKSFELAYTMGDCTGCMTSFNRVGAVPAAGNYYLTQRVLREEWGFYGVVITDAYSSSGMSKAGIMQRSGHTGPLGNYDSTNRICGSWDSTQNCVVDDSGIQWDTQYYWTRIAAKTYLYVQANSNMIQNGTSVSSFSGEETITVYAGAEFSESIGLDADELGSEYGEYVVTSGTLPDGLELDSLTGEISGSPTCEEGDEFDVEITLTVDGCYSSTKSFHFDVEDAFYATGFDDIEAGGECTGAITSDVMVANPQEFWSTDPVNPDPTLHYYGRTAVTYSSDDLPGTLSMDEDGNVTGTYPEEGIYVFNVEVEVEDKELEILFGVSVVGQSYTYTYYTRTYTLIVGDNAGIYSGDVSADYTNTDSDGEETDSEYAALLEEIESLNSTIDSLESAVSDLETSVSELEAEVDSLSSDTSNTDSGCGSVISIAGASAVAIITALTAAAVVLVKKKDERK